MAALESALRRVAGTAVYVGIPEEEAPRATGEINNATLLFIQTNGSPLRSIPPRPVIEPAIADPQNKALITEELGLCAAAILEYDPIAAKQHLERAGMLGSNAAKEWFTNPANNWARNAPATIRQKGSDSPLIDTAQMRRAVTWVTEEPK